MVKHKIPADVHPRPSHSVRALADRYFCEQCDRLGLPRPHAIAPVSLRSGKPIKLGKTMREVVVDRAKMDRDTADGLAIEAMLLDTRLAPLGGEPAPKMGLEAILRAYIGGDDNGQRE